MAGTTPVVLLDVDGVINAISSKPDRNVWPADQWRRVTGTTSEGDQWPILAAQPVLAFLSRLHDDGLAEIRWHTTWQHAAATNLAPQLGLPDWPIADAPEFTAFSDSGYIHGVNDWWKLAAAERVVLNERRALIWIDDDINFAHNPAMDLLRRMPSTLLVSPAPSIGLSKRDLRAIAAYLDIEYP